MRARLVTARLTLATLTCSAMVAVAAGCGVPSAGVTAERSEDAGIVVDEMPTIPSASTTSPDSTISPDSTAPPPTGVVESTSPSSPTTVEMAQQNNDPPPDGGIIDFGTNKPPREYDNFVDRAFVDITAFWNEQYPAQYGGAFVPISAIYAVYPDRNPPAQCDGNVEYEWVELNAKFVDCGGGVDVILYDDEQLVPQLVEQFGAVSVAVVAAHEYGHAISSRAGVFETDLRTIDLEQQADCFAGAWVGHVARGESDLLQFTESDVKASIAAMIYIRDPVGLDSANDESGHGSAFDRVGAFQDGYLEGVTRCAEYPTRPNPRLDLFFLPGTVEAQQGGNMPYADITEELPKALDTFWVKTITATGIEFTAPTVEPFPHAGPYPACDGRTSDQILGDPASFCLDSNTIIYNEDYLHALYDNFGDLAFGYPIAAAYGDAVQHALSFPLTGEDRVLLDDCLVGAWIRDIVPNGVDESGNPVATNPEQTILLSAGDLDEVVSTAVLQGDASATLDVRGTAFDKIDAFRTGVLDSLPGCQTLIDSLNS